MQLDSGLDTQLEQLQLQPSQNHAEPQQQPLLMVRVLICVRSGVYVSRGLSTDTSCVPGTPMQTKGSMMAARSAPCMVKRVVLCRTYLIRL